MPVKFNIDKTLELYKEKGGTTKFPDSLRSVLRYIQNDTSIQNMNEVAYLLATAKGESDYSLERWESDYLCGNIGEKYKGKPCQKALNYYASTEGGKKNYYTLGVDKNGLPYFGRGLIGLTGKANYQKYGDLIGVNLVDDSDKALVPLNSYLIASTYMNERTFKYVNKGDLTMARKSVNGGTKGLSVVNSAYNLWLSIFENPSVNFKSTALSLKQRRVLGISIITLSLVVVGISIYFVVKSTNKN